MKIAKIDNRGVTINKAEPNFISWRDLRAAARINSMGATTKDEYQQLYEDACRAALRIRPTSVRVGEYATNLYGVMGEAISGERSPIRAFDCGLDLLADEGMEHPARRYAAKEADEIAKRNNIASLALV